MIGVFDSGIGGLTVFAALRRALPHHDLLYLGDTARVPYGTRSPLTVQRYSLRVASFLHRQGIDALVVACNTATTHALPALTRAARAAGIQVFGVVEPGVEAALAAHRHGAVAVLGTEGTISGGAYQAALLQRAPELAVEAVACPLFVPLVEEGWTEGPVPLAVAEAYLGTLRGHIDTAILGCTHYPLLRSVLARVLPNVMWVDSAETTAATVKRALPDPGPRTPVVRYMVTDHVQRFQRVGQAFLGSTPTPVDWVDLGPALPPFDDDSCAALH